MGYVRNLNAPGHGYDSTAQHNFLTDHDGLITTPTGEQFWLSNRHWEAINISLGELPELAIDYKLRTIPPSDEVVVLDIGAGARGTAMGELQEYFAHATRKPRVIGVDLTNRFDVETPPNKLLADATHLPLKDASVDVAYSHQALALIGDLSTDAKRRELLQPAIDEAVRVLKPGGVLIIDLDIPYDRAFTAQHGLERLQLPPTVEAYWSHRDPKDEQPVGNFILAAIIKGDSTNDGSGLIDELGLQADRKIEP